MFIPSNTMNGWAMRKSKKLRFHHAALRRHVEAAQFRVDQRQHRWQEDVRRKHRLVDLIPERMPMLSLYPRVRQRRKDKVWERVREDRRPVSRHVGLAEDQIDQRRGQKDQPRQRIQKVRHRIEVAKPLRRRKPARKQRILDPQNLHHAPSPADALLHMAAQTLRRKPRRLRNIDVRRIPAVHLHPQRRMRVLGHGLGRDPTHLVQRRSPEHRAGAAEKRRIPEVVAILHHAVEQLAFVRNHAELVQIPLKRIG
jgi:hypothetical protein